jgi:hypothetical protein
MSPTAIATVTTSPYSHNLRMAVMVSRPPSAAKWVRGTRGLAIP